MEVSLPNEKGGRGCVSKEAYFTSIYREMYRLLFIYAKHAFEGRDTLAEEAVQETFLLLWVNLEAVMKRENPRGWLMLTLKNVIRNMKRSQARLVKLLLALRVTIPEEHAMDPLSVDTLYANLQQDPDYVLLKAFALEGKSVKELAQGMGISVAACKKRLQRAKERLQKIINSS